MASRRAWGNKRMLAVVIGVENMPRGAAAKSGVNRRFMLAASSAERSRCCAIVCDIPNGAVALRRGGMVGIMSPIILNGEWRLTMTRRSAWRHQPSALSCPSKPCRREA